MRPSRRGISGGRGETAAYLVGPRLDVVSFEDAPRGEVPALDVLELPNGIVTVRTSALAWPGQPCGVTGATVVCDDDARHDMVRRLAGAVQVDEDEEEIGAT